MPVGKSFARTTPRLESSAPGTQRGFSVRWMRRSGNRSRRRRPSEQGAGSAGHTASQIGQDAGIVCAPVWAQGLYRPEQRQVDLLAARAVQRADADPETQATRGTHAIQVRV